MCGSGQSEPILVRVVGFVLRTKAHGRKEEDGETIITVRIVVPNGWNLAKNILDKHSTDSRCAVFFFVIKEHVAHFFLVLDTQVAIDGISFRGKWDVNVTQVRLST